MPVLQPQSRDFVIIIIIISSIVLLFVRLIASPGSGRVSTSVIAVLLLLLQV